MAETDGLAETNYAGHLIAYVMEAIRTHSFDSRVLQDFIDKAEKRGFKGGLDWAYDDATSDAEFDRGFKTWKKEDDGR